MAQAVYWILFGLIMLAFPASLFMWGRMMYRRGSACDGFLEAAVVARKRTRPFWSPVDFLLMYVTMFGLTVLFLRVSLSQGWQIRPGQSLGEDAEILSLIARTISSAMAGVGALLIAVGWLRLCNRDWRRIIGLTFSRQDVRLGLGGAVMILPPVLLITLGVNQIVEYHHPVLDTIAKSPDPRLFVAMFVSTAMITPVVEEFMVRGLLQGGLQGLIDRETDESGLWRPLTYWPVVLSSGIFAAMHMGHGAAPIPLFFLSLGMGYLYRQTGRLAAPIIVHAILNGLTLCMAFTTAPPPT